MTSNKKRLKKILLIGLVGFLFLAIGGLAAMRVWIQGDVNRYRSLAREAHPEEGSDVEVLTAYVRSDSHSLKEKNHIVWAMGQIRDARALPVLREAVTGEECDHAKSLCQSELKKAIALCEGTTPNPLFIK